MENTKRCFQCGKEKSLEDFHPCFGNKSIRKNRCKACYGERERIKLRLEMFNALGWECACCGEKHPYFLTLDHVNNDGNSNRTKSDYLANLKLRKMGVEVEIKRAYGNQQQLRQARREGWPKDRYQILCFSCNCAKGHFGECPHKTGLTAEEVIADMERKTELVGRKHVNYSPIAQFKKGHSLNKHNG